MGHHLTLRYVNYLHPYKESFATKVMSTYNYYNYAHTYIHTYINTYTIPWTITSDGGKAVLFLLFLHSWKARSMREQDWHSTLPRCRHHNNFVILHHMPRLFGACGDSVYQALLFPPPRERPPMQKNRDWRRGHPAVLYD